MNIVQAELTKKRRLEATPDPEGPPPPDGQQPLQTSLSSAVSAGESDVPGAAVDDDDAAGCEGERLDSCQLRNAPRWHS